MNPVKSLVRAWTGTPKCAYCSADGIWSREGQPVCEAHRNEVRACGFRRTSRRV